MAKWLCPICGQPHKSHLTSHVVEVHGLRTLPWKTIWEDDRGPICPCGYESISWRDFYNHLDEMGEKCGLLFIFVGEANNVG